MTPVPVRLGYLLDDDLDFEAVIVATYNGEDTLEIQRALEFDEDDVDRGWDTYCLVATGQRTVYGGMESVATAVVDGQQVLTLTMSAEAAAELGLDYEIELAVDPAELREVMAHLLRILGLNLTTDR